MALRGNKATNTADGIPKSSYFEASSNIRGFDINAYRKANKLNLYLKPGQGKVIKLFSAFTTGNFGFDAKVDMGDYGKMFTDKLNTLFGDSWRSLLSSAGKTFDAGNSWAGSFDAPIKPFIKGSEPLSFDVDCILPLIVKGDGTDSFVKNIERPLNDLLYVTIPTKQNTITQTIENANKWLRDAIDGLFVDAQAEGVYWEFVQNAIHDYQDNFFSGIYMLNNPIQYDKSNNIILRLGPWRLDNVYITGVQVQYSPLIYNDGSTVYPSYAKVKVSFITKYKLTTDLLNIDKSGVTDAIAQMTPKEASEEPNNDTTPQINSKNISTVRPTITKYTEVPGVK